jgi:hypothetical protein
MNKNILIVLVVVLLLGLGVLVYGYQDKAMETTQTGISSTTVNVSDNPSTVTPMTVTSGENPRPGSPVHDLPVEPAAAAARKDLALKLGVSERSIVIMMVENRMWSGGCLGLGAPTEVCTDAMVEGFRVELLAQGNTYFYRTNKTGSILRQE